MAAGPSTRLCVLLGLISSACYQISHGLQQNTQIPRDAKTRLLPDFSRQNIPWNIKANQKRLANFPAGSSLRDEENGEINFDAATQIETPMVSRKKSARDNLNNTFHNPSINERRRRVKILRNIAKQVAEGRGAENLPQRLTGGFMNNQQIELSAKTKTRTRSHSVISPVSAEFPPTTAPTLFVGKSENTLPRNREGRKRNRRRHVFSHLNQNNPNENAALFLNSEPSRTSLSPEVSHQSLLAFHPELSAGDRTETFDSNSDVQTSHDFENKEISKIENGENSSSDAQDAGSEKVTIVKEKTIHSSSSQEEQESVNIEKNPLHGELNTEKTNANRDSDSRRNKNQEFRNSKLADEGIILTLGSRIPGRNYGPEDDTFGFHAGAYKNLKDSPPQFGKRIKIIRVKKPGNQDRRTKESPSVQNGKSLPVHHEETSPYHVLSYEPQEHYLRNHKNWQEDSQSNNPPQGYQQEVSNEKLNTPQHIPVLYKEGEHSRYHSPSEAPDSTFHKDEHIILDLSGEPGELYIDQNTGKIIKIITPNFSNRPSKGTNDESTIYEHSYEPQNGQANVSPEFSDGKYKIIQNENDEPSRNSDRTEHHKLKKFSETNRNINNPNSDSYSSNGLHKNSQGNKNAENIHYKIVDSGDNYSPLRTKGNEEVQYVYSTGDRIAIPVSHIPHGNGGKYHDDEDNYEYIVVCDKGSHNINEDNHQEDGEALQIEDYQSHANNKGSEFPPAEHESYEKGTDFVTKNHVDGIHNNYSPDYKHSGGEVSNKDKVYRENTYNFGKNEGSSKGIKHTFPAKEYVPKFDSPSPSKGYSSENENKGFSYETVGNPIQKDTHLSLPESKKHFPGQNVHNKGYNKNTNIRRPHMQQKGGNTFPPNGHSQNFAISQDQYNNLGNSGQSNIVHFKGSGFATSNNEKHYKKLNLNILQNQGHSPDLGIPANQNFGHKGNGNFRAPQNNKPYKDVDFVKAQFENNFNKVKAMSFPNQGHLKGTELSSPNYSGEQYSFTGDNGGYKQGANKFGSSGSSLYNNGGESVPQRQKQFKNTKFPPSQSSYIGSNLDTLNSNGKTAGHNFDDPGALRGPSMGLLKGLQYGRPNLDKQPLGVSYIPGLKNTNGGSSQYGGIEAISVGRPQEVGEPIHLLLVEEDVGPGGNHAQYGNDNQNVKLPINDQIYSVITDSRLQQQQPNVKIEVNGGKDRVFPIKQLATVGLHMARSVLPKMSKQKEKSLKGNLSFGVEIKKGGGLNDGIQYQIESSKSISKVKNG